MEKSTTIDTNNVSQSIQLTNPFDLVDQQQKEVEEKEKTYALRSITSKIAKILWQPDPFTGEKPTETNKELIDKKTNTNNNPDSLNTSNDKWLIWQITRRFAKKIWQPDPFTGEKPTETNNKSTFDEIMAWANKVIGNVWNTLSNTMTKIEWKITWEWNKQENKEPDISKSE